MSENLEFDNLDTMLTQALRARPEAHVPTNLSSRAMEISATVTRAMHELARVRRINRIVTGVAAVLIVALTVWILHTHLATGGFQAWTDTGITSSDTTTASSSSDSGISTTMQWLYISAAVAVGAIVVVVMQRTLGGNDEWAPVIG